MPDLQTSHLGSHFISNTLTSSLADLCLSALKFSYEFISICDPCKLIALAEPR